MICEGSPGGSIMATSLGCRRATRATILVVDDTPESLRHPDSHARACGHDRPDSAGWSSRRWTSLEHVTPDLVLMDAVMPGLDGFNTTRRIKCGRPLPPPSGDLHDGTDRDRARHKRAGGGRGRLCPESRSWSTNCWPVCRCTSPMPASPRAVSSRSIRPAGLLSVSARTGPSTG